MDHVIKESSKVKQDPEEEVSTKEHCSFLSVFGKGKRLQVFAEITQDQKKQNKNLKKANKKKKPVNVDKIPNKFKLDNEGDEKANFVINSNSIISSQKKKLRKKVLLMNACPEEQNASLNLF
mmetsp:Transcript_29576/g.28787  ORF Transcript_29576/g.28787 Transcript_29576/m.28787 type:complete len:122 (-) Transcript_29576:74-439(-)